MLPNRRAAMHVAPVVRRLKLMWIATCAVAVAIFLGEAYSARLVVGICWLVFAGLFFYALNFFSRLR